MKKYIFILTFFSLLIGNIAHAYIDLSAYPGKVSINDNILSLKVDYAANANQQVAQKIVYTGYTKKDGGAVLQAISGFISVNSTSNPDINGTTTVSINLDKTKHATGTTFIVYLKDNDASDFDTNFTTPASYSAAAGTGNFYYTTDYDLGSTQNYSVYKNDVNKSFFRFTTKAACNTAWKAAIDELYTVNMDRSRKFTECFESNTLPSLNTFIGNLKEYGTFPSSVPFYYYSWKAHDNTWKRSNGYKLESDCIKEEKINFAKGIVAHCTSSTTPPKQPANWDGNAVSVTPTTNTPYKDEYKLLAPIPGLTDINSKTTFGDYLNIIFKVGMGLLIALSVIMLVIHGIQYMGDESVFGKTEAMHSIRATIGGLILALGAYAILNTINPDLVNGKLDIKQLTVRVESNPITFASGYRLSQAGTSTFSRIPGVYDRVKNFVSSVDYSSNGYTNKIPHCLVQAAVLRESGGDSSDVGHDEDAPLTGIGSRTTFIQSGTKYSKETFTGKSETDNTFFNDDHIAPHIHTATNPNAEDLGLDWRFSHGIGLMQITFFPENSSEKLKYNKPFETAVTKTKMSLKDMFNEGKAMQAGTELLQYNYKRCDGDAFRTYKAYGAGSCDSTNPTTIQEAFIRKSLYDQCVAQDN